MKIEIKTKNYEIGKKLTGLIEKKVGKLAKYFNDDKATAQVMCKTENKTDVLELSIFAKGSYYRSEVRSDNMYNNLDIALPKLERQIIKSRQKQSESFKMPMLADDLMFLEDFPTYEENKIVKKKKFMLDPISVEDATFMLDATEHDFYAFLNRDTNKVNLVYRRRDGDIGHIELDY